MNDSMHCVIMFRDSPVVQGNSILALSGLAAVLAKYESNLPTDSDSSLGVRYQCTFDIVMAFLCHM